MSHNVLPVVAAIPNYNMADSLAVLVPQVLEQEYDDVYVLDDASTDHSREVVEAFAPDVHFVAGKQNLNAGGNRSRIIDALSHNAVIHFLDADVRLESERTPEIVRDLTADPAIGFVGGLVRTADGLQTFWNHGPRMCLHTRLTASLQGRIEKLNRADSSAAQLLRERFDGVLQEWPNPFEPPQPRRTFWTQEANIAILSETFRLIGGYSPRIKGHEVQDLSLRLEGAGLRRQFDPTFAVTHTNGRFRSDTDTTRRLRAEAQIIRKHGIASWLLPEGRFKPEA